ncbi:MAG: GNAT family N-acetyltransferase [Gammaproteobacteria bacterium]|nr:GNAT family N-acetyltransferase [Gammaproteobacteria bacterium]MBU1416758.1 GNAT family N-acetyltransferase [Gammaproteobacteria bacterium]
MPTIDRLTGAADISEADWQRLSSEGDPFVSRAFLCAAETFGVADNGPLGWQPMHLALRDDQRKLVGLLPLYARSHWYNDFAGDCGWEQAWHQAGLAYFPKFVTGVPHTPSPGPRLLTVHDAGPEVPAALIAAAIDLTATSGASNWQCLFVREHDRAPLEAAGLLMRRGVQFHWRNRGYRDFGDFLAAFTSEKRKKMKRERRAVGDAGLHIEARHGDEIDGVLWQAIHRHYRSTFERLGGLASFPVDFFRSVGAALGKQMVVFVAFDGEGDERPVASAVCYRDDTALYGRHWGTDIDCPGLHFELCYHAGVEYAIEHGLQRFEPGAHGEHKVARGFEPVSTWSAFWVADPAMRGAVARYLARENGAVQDYQAEMAAHLPFRLSHLQADAARD